MSLSAEATKRSKGAGFTRPLFYRPHTYFLTNARREIDNNVAENAMRGIALGRKNYLFASADSGVDQAAVMYSIVQTAKMNDLDPAKIAEGHPISRIIAPQDVDGRGEPGQLR